MILDGDHQRPWNEGREARQPHRVHRPQPAGGQNPRRASRAASRDICHRRAGHSVASVSQSGIGPEPDRTRTDTNTVSVVERTRAGSRRRRGHGRAFSRPHRRVRARRGSDAVRRAGRRAAARRGSRRRDPGHGRRRHSASSPAAMTARWWRPTPRARPSIIATDAEASLDRSCRARARAARSPGRPARRRSRRARSCANSRRLRPSAAWPSCRKASALRSPITTARRCGFPTRTEATAGNAGMEGLASRRDRQSRRPLSGHDHAGADAAWLAARRPQAHAHVGLRRAGDVARLDRGRRLARHFGRERSSSCGRSRARTGRWARSRALLAPAEHRVEVVACSSGASRSSPPAIDDGMVLFVRIEDGAEILARKPGDAPVTRARLERGRPIAGVRHGRRRSRRASICVTSGMDDPKYGAPCF